jgi:DivIVA domain-containing protein
MSNKLELKQKEILEKKFNKSIHSGYDPEDVDTFFDEVIDYLNEVNDITKKIYDENTRLNQEISKLHDEIERKDQLIQTNVQELDNLKAEGYSNKRTSDEIRQLREAIRNKHEK